MSERGKFFDDLAGVAGGALSALAGLREEVESTMRARVEEAIRKLDLVRREELGAVAEMASNARAAQERLEARVVALEARLAASPSSAAAASSSSASAGVTESAAFGSASAFTDSTDFPPPAPDRAGPGE